MSALESPVAAYEESVRALASARKPIERMQLARTAGNAARELRKTAESRRYLRIAVSEARRAGDRTQEGLALMSAAATETYAGDFAQAFAMLLPMLSAFLLVFFL